MGYIRYARPRRGHVLFVDEDETNVPLFAPVLTDEGNSMCGGGLVGLKKFVFCKKVIESESKGCKISSHKRKTNKMILSR
jgi:hypothetical protein